MAICPKDLKPCCDDICYRGGCILLGGESLLTTCHGCGQLVPMNGGPSDGGPSDVFECECEPEYYDEDE